MISILPLLEASILPSLTPEEKEKTINRIKKETDERLEKRKGTVLMYNKNKILGKSPIGSNINKEIS